MASFLIESDLLRNVNWLTHEGISERKIESLFKFGLCGSHQIKKSLWILGSCKLLFAQSANLLRYSVQTDERSSTNSIFSQIVDALFANGNSVNHDKV